MNKEKCFECIKNGIVKKNKLWRENKLTWGEDVELSKILQSACSYAGINVQEVSEAALKVLSRNPAADEYLKMAAAWKPGQLWV